MAFEKENMRQQVERVLAGVIGESEWANESAPKWSKAALDRINPLFTMDRYKLVVLTEVLSPGAGRNLNLSQLVAGGDCVLSVEHKNSKGVTAYALVCACKY
eukprot:NODE_6830_length_496_cov_31.051491_g6664_i0.p1 GENE.NODE_6830_length_496_cov_31.051491_g6664_i0~~NODE_6830_length_496_cov_31.051491_g6664_i0.p1  ORF type:complete len:102 (-),score=35.46 NODE_6830_length_496_cov_31.051491_g6664_i0:110-415(-)